MRYTRVALTCGVILGYGTVLRGQAPVTLDKPVTFVHGFGSSGSTWNLTSLSTLQLLRARTFSPDLSPFAAMDGVQAQQLLSAINGYFTANPTERMPLVAHSQGGQVSRAYARLAGNRINGLVTVGSPHLGTPIATAALSGRLQLDLNTVHNFVLEPITWYSQNDPQFNNPFQIGGPVGWVDDFVQAILNPWAQYLCGYFGVCNLVGGQLTPSAVQHQPGSVFHQTLAQSASVENQVLGGNRVSIVGTVSPVNAMFRLVSPTVQYAAAVIKEGAVLAYLGEYFEYSSHPSPILAQHASKWFTGASAIQFGYDLAWSGIVADNATMAHDGFIPEWSQVMNGSTLTIPVGDIAHTEETTGTAAEVRQGLSWIGVAPRPAGSVAYVAPIPTQATMSVGSVLPISVQLRDIYWVPLSGKAVTWVSRSPSIASVSATGVVTALSPGQANIESISEGYGAFTALTVIPYTPLSAVSIGGPTAGYANQQLSYTAQVSSGATPLTYAWTVNGATQQQGSNASFQWVAGASYQVGVTVTDNIGAQVGATRYVAITSCGQQIC